MKFFMIIIYAFLFGYVAEITGQDLKGAVASEEQGREQQRTAAGEVPAPAKSVFRKMDGMLVFEGTDDALRKHSWKIRIFDNAGDTWHVVDYNDDSLSAMSEPGGKFRPFSFRSGNFDLQFRVRRASKHWFEVVVQEEKPEIPPGYVRAGDRLFRYYRWDSWVLSHLNLRFDGTQNPVLDAVGGRYAKLTDASGLMVDPLEVKGDWVRVRWRPMSKHPEKRGSERFNKDDSGWLRWRSGKKILVWEYYP